MDKRLEFLNGQKPEKILPILELMTEEECDSAYEDEEIVCEKTEFDPIKMDIKKQTEGLVKSLQALLDEDVIESKTDSQIIYKLKIERL